MSFKNLFVVVVFGFALALAGCKGSEEKKEDAKKEDTKKAEADKKAKEDAAKKAEADKKAKEDAEKAKAEADKVKAEADAAKAKAEADAAKAKEEADAKVKAEEEAKAKAEAEAKAKAEAEAKAAPKVDEAVKTEIVTALGNLQKAAVARKVTDIVALLPASYVADVKALAAEVAGKLDAEVMTKATALVDRIVAVAQAKKEEIVKMVGQFVPAEDLPKIIDGVANLWGAMKAAKLNDIEALKNFDLVAVLGALEPVFNTTIEGLTEGSKAMINAQTEMIGKAAFDVVPGEKEGEILVVVKVGEQEVDKFAVVKVEDKYVPAEMAEGWKKAIEEAKAGLAAITPEAVVAVKAQIDQFAQVVETIANAPELAKALNDANLGALFGAGEPKKEEVVDPNAPKAEEAPKPEEKPAPATDGAAPAPAADPAK